MRFLDQWQKVVHSRNVEKGFYDYKGDLFVAQGVLNRLHADDEDRTTREIAVTPEETAALKRIVQDYSKAQIERKLLLVIGELCEAHEELRAGHAPAEVYYNGTSRKPEGFGIEGADAEIRLLDLFASLGLDMNALMELKHTYNGTRPYKHGKQF